MSRKAVFLDRDGTLIHDVHYLSKVEEIEWCPGVFEHLRQLKDWRFELIIITNQSGIGRGYFTEEDYQKVTMALKQQAQEENIEFTGIYHCPHWPDKDGECACRKPGTALFERAIRDHDLDISRCVAVGDRQRDVNPAALLGASQTFVVEKNRGLDFMMAALGK